MRRKRIRIFFFFILIPLKIYAADVNEASSTAAKNWPSFRGSNASGVGDGGNLPTRWNVEKALNIKWKTSIPGLAHSSPIIWGNRIFVTTAISTDPDSALRVGLFGDIRSAKDYSKHTWKVYCLDKNGGKVTWEKTAYEGIPKVKRHTKATQANATPATDGVHVVALFGAEGLYCYNFAGELLWQQDLGLLDAGWLYWPHYQWGHGSSPIIYKNLVILQCDKQRDSYIAAYHIEDGKQVWSTPRDEVPSWGTPTIHEGQTGVELIANGTNHIRGYDPMTGKELWQFSGSSKITVPTPIVAHDLIYLTSGYRPIQPIYAVRPGAMGDITLQKGADSNNDIVWSKKRGGPYMPTPIVFGDYFYTCANNGTVTCYNAKTGKQIYRERLDGRGGGYAFTASPVATTGKLYFTSEDGEIYVVQAGPTYKLVSKNEMGEICMATPAISDRMMVIRTQQHVYAIGE